jgi:hypothetical protein
MKKLLVLLISILVNGISSQSWEVFGPQNEGEAYNIALELQDNTVAAFYQYNIRDSLGNYINTVNILEHRESSGQLINQYLLDRKDTILYLNASLVMGKNILLLYQGIQIITRKRFHFIQMRDEHFNVVFEKSINVENTILFDAHLIKESDTTAIALTTGESQVMDSIFTSLDSSILFRIHTSGLITDYKVWIKLWELNFDNICLSLNSDSIIALAGQHVYVLDKQFNPTFSKALNFSITHSWGSLVQFKRNSYLLFDTYIFYGRLGFHDIGIAKLNKNLDTLKTVRIGELRVSELAASGYFYNPDSENSIFMVGNKNPGVLPEDIPIIITRLDTNLNVLWTKYYLDNHYRDLQNIYATQDGGILIAGQRRNIQDLKLNPTAYLIKIDKDGNLPTATNNIEKDIPWSITVYPNPSTRLFEIKLDRDFDNLRVKIIDLNGNNLIISKTLQKGMNSLDLNYLPNGMYIYSISRDGKDINMSGKWMKAQ